MNLFIRVNLVLKGLSFFMLKKTAYCVACCAAYICVWIMDVASVNVCVFSRGGGVIAVYWSPAAWCLRNEGVSSVLLGASSTDQLMENIGAIQVRPQNVSACLCVRSNEKLHLWKMWPGPFNRAHLRAFRCVTAASTREYSSAFWAVCRRTLGCFTVPC